jgi:hypothetical protein
MIVFASFFFKGIKRERKSAAIYGRCYGLRSLRPRRHTNVSRRRSRGLLQTREAGDEILSTFYGSVLSILKIIVFASFFFTEIKRERKSAAISRRCYGMRSLRPDTNTNVSRRRQRWTRSLRQRISYLCLAKTFVWALANTGSWGRHPIPFLWFCIKHSKNDRLRELFL